MKINEICKALNITRQGLYWILENNDLEGHAIRKPSGRWQIDQDGFELLRAIRMKSTKVIVDTLPADPHSAETIRGMQIEIDKLAAELRKEQLKHEQGLFFANSVEDLAKESKVLDVSIKRELLRLVKAFRSETTEKAIKKQLKAEQKAKKPNEKILENIGQQRLF